MREILTPDEIAALTAAFATDVAPPTVPAGTVRPFELASPERPLEGRAPGLELVLGRFARGVRGVLAASFGDTPGVTAATVGLVRFARLAPSLAETAGLVRFRMPPLRGQGVLTIPPSLVAALLQVSCGGTVREVAALPPREPSAVELRLIERLAVRVLAEHHPTGYPEPELRLFLSRNALKAIEVPVRGRPRPGGRTSLTPGRLTAAGARVLLAMIIVPLRHRVGLARD